MKRKTLIPILVIEALILAGLAVLTMLVPNLFSSVLAFPMEQIQRLLRHPWAYKLMWLMERCLFKIEKAKRKKQ